MVDRAKLLPAVVAALGLLFGLKVVAVWTGVNAVLTTPAVAQETQEEPESDAEGDAETETAEGSTDGTEAPGAAAEANLSDTEIAVLKNLAERRQTLEARERELETREKLISAAEGRVESKITELKDIELRIESLLGQRDEAEEAQMRRLVKVYETMKPKDAAPIFQKLDQDILLDVAARMKESSVAGIMAAMDPASAQELTTMLAQRLTLPETAQR